MFGQAGFLQQDFDDDYPNLLKKEYEFLKHKYQLVPIEKHLWKFLRLRPSNFPTLRIAQFSNLVFQSNALFSKILEIENLEEIKKLLKVDLSGYWDSHYLLDKKSITRKKSLGEASINIILINTIVPFIFIYGLVNQIENLKERSIKFLEQINPEINVVVEKWAALGVSIKSAYTTQGLLELKNEYCNEKKCLNCAIGVKILKL